MTTDEILSLQRQAPPEVRNATMRASLAAWRYWAASEPPDRQIIARAAAVEVTLIACGALKMLGR